MDPIEVGIAVAIITAAGGSVAIVMQFARALLVKWTRSKEAVGPGEAEELRHAISRLAGDVADLNERLDFTERVLATERERGQLRGGN